MNDEDGHRIEAAEQFGFESAEVFCGKTEVWSCTQDQMIAFAKACERKGLADAVALLQRWAGDAEEFKAVSARHEIMQNVCRNAATALNNKIIAVDAELGPILAAEEARSMTAAGYIRGTTDEPGKRWVKP